jgi:hypothetical protein
MFVENGHQVTVLDLSEIIHPMLSNEQSNTQLEWNFDLHVLKSWKELKHYQETIKSHDIAMLLIQSFGLSRSTYPVLKCLSRTDTPYLILAPILLPGLDPEFDERSLIARIWDRLFELDRINLLNSIIARLTPSLLGIQSAKYMVYNGLASQTPNSLVDVNTQSIYAHTADFDRCIAHVEDSNAIGEHIAFIDQFIPEHPDALALGIKNVPESDNYYAYIRRFFDLAEVALGIPVVIAAHPRAKYEIKDKRFGGRDITYGETVPLIAKSRLVLAHISTAIGIAVILRKPLAIMTTPSLLDFDSNHRLIYSALSKLLDVPLWPIDQTENFDFDGALNVNDARYDKYIRRYVKSQGSPDETLWQIVETAIQY